MRGSGKEFCECPYCHNYALKHMSKEKYSLMFGDERMKKKLFISEESPFEKQLKGYNLIFQDGTVKLGERTLYSQRVKAPPRIVWTGMYTASIQSALARHVITN